MLTGLIILHLNYWGTNQFIVQRALAARSGRDARIGIVTAGCHQSRLVAGVVVAFTMGMFWKRATPWGGLVAIVSGISFSYGLTALYNSSLYQIGF